MAEFFNHQRRRILIEHLIDRRHHAKVHQLFNHFTCFDRHLLGQIAHGDVLGNVHVINDFFGGCSKACWLGSSESFLRRPPRRRATPASAASRSLIERLWPRCLPRAPGTPPRSRRPLPGRRRSSSWSWWRSSFDGRHATLGCLRSLILTVACAATSSACRASSSARALAAASSSSCRACSSAFRREAARWRSSSGSSLSGRIRRCPLLQQRTGSVASAPDPPLT